MESKLGLFGQYNGVHIEYDAAGSYNFILVPEGELAKIQAVLAAYMALLKKPGYNGRPSLLIKEIPADENKTVMRLGRRNEANAVVAGDETFICLRGQQFRGGLQEKLHHNGYKLVNIDGTFVF